MDDMILGSIFVGVGRFVLRLLGIGYSRLDENGERKRGVLVSVIRSSSLSATGVDTLWQTVRLRVEPGRLSTADGYVKLKVVGLTVSNESVDGVPTNSPYPVRLVAQAPRGTVDWVIPCADVGWASEKLGFPLGECDSEDGQGWATDAVNMTKLSSPLDDVLP